MKPCQPPTAEDYACPELWKIILTGVADGWVSNPDGTVQVVCGRTVPSYMSTISGGLF